MATLTRRFAWLPREPQPQPLSDKAVQIVQILQRYPKGLSASEIVKRSGGAFLVNHVYVYLRRLQARGIVRVLPPEKTAAASGQRDVLRATLAPGQIVRRGAGEGRASSGESRRSTATESRRSATATESRRGESRRAAPAEGRRTAAEPATRRGSSGESRRGETRRSQAAAGH